jgi:glycerate kinase
MKILLAPDKFKGSLSSFAVCEALKKGLSAVQQNIRFMECPMADGGDGFASVMQYYLNTTSISCATTDPIGRSINSTYQWKDSTKTAIIEMAAASGLVLLREEEKNPLVTSTFGTGLLFLDAIKRGAGKIILGVGGSATNDGGTGVLAALGFEFLDEHNQPLSPCGGNLIRIKAIHIPGLTMLPEIDMAADVQNLLYGEQGAAYVYGPQKGADEKMVKQLDSGLRNFARVIELQTGKNISNVPGGGAAGGIVAGLHAFLNVNLKKGVELIAKAAAIEEKMADADLVITGEGRIDDQSSEGKVVGYIAQLAKKYAKPCLAICGIASAPEKLASQLNLQKIVSLTGEGVSAAYAMKNANKLIEIKAQEFLVNH